MADSFVLNAELGPVIARYLEQNSPVESNREQCEKKAINKCNDTK